MARLRLPQEQEDLDGRRENPDALASKLLFFRTLEM
jgi:hypothetical protein